MSPKPSFNPFPGLRPFGIEEDYLFFGREEQVSELLALLRKHRFLAVVGTSGSGKSSLVRAGLLPALHGGTLTQAGSSWEVVLLRPGGDPIANLARTFIEADLYDGEDDESLPRVKATLTRSSTGLVEAVKQSDLPADTNLLVVVDQFEELFRFRDSGLSGQEGAAAFVKLLLAATGQQEQPIYVAITMRSDYLGDCAQIPGLAEAVNDGEYLIPRLSRKQRRAAIEKPVHVGGGTISAPLIHKLLNEVGDDADQLPVLQHALMRIWDHWTSGDNADQPIGLTDYEQVGGLQEALSQHADEVYAELPDDRHRMIAERLFQAITERGPDNRGIRRPTRFDHLCELVGADAADVALVIDAFRRGGRTFLMPPENVELGPQTIIDISHESLMRVWRQLRDWVEQESQSARIYRRLADTAALHQEGKAGLYHDPDLQIASSWRQTRQPNQAWASRYHSGFESAMAFLDASYQASQAEEQAREAARQRELEQANKLAEAERHRAEIQRAAARRLRGMVAGFAVVAAIAVVASAIAFNAKRDSDQAKRLAEDAREDAVRLRIVAQESADSAKLSAADAQREATRASLKQAEAEAAQAALKRKQFSSDMVLAHHAYNDGNIGAVSAHLLDHVPPPGETDARGIEWYLWWNASHQESSIINRHGTQVYSVAISPDGRLAADSHWNHEIRIRETLNPQRTRSIDVADAGQLRDLCFSSDSSMLAAISGRSVYRFGTEDVTSLGSVDARADLHGLCFSPTQDTIVSGGEDGQLYFWNTKTWERTEFTASSESLPISSVAYSPDGSRLVIGTDHAGGSILRLGVDSPLVLWDPATNSIQKTAAGHTGPITSVAWSPDGEYLASGSYDATLRVWTKDLTPVQTLDSVAWVSGAAFSPDGKYLAAATGKDNAIRIWSTETWEIAVTIKGNSRPVNSIAFEPSRGDLWSGSEDGSIKIWDIEQHLGQPIDVLSEKDLRAMLTSATEAVVASDGRTLFCGGEDRPIERYDLQSQLVMSPWSGGKSFRRVAFSDDGAVVSAVSSDDRLQVWRTGSEELIAEVLIPEEASELRRLAVSCDGAIVAWTTGSELDLVLVDTKSGNRLKQPLGMRHARWGFLRISPDARQLVIKNNFLCRQFDISDFRSDGTPPREMGNLANMGLANDFVFSQDRTVDAGLGWDSVIHLVDPQANQELQTLEGHASQVYCGAFSRDGRRLLSGGLDGTVRIWDVETGASLATLRGHESGVSWVGFRAEDSQIVSMSKSDGTVRIWHAAAREKLPQDPLYWVELAEHRAQARRQTEALAAYEKAVRLSPQNSELLLARAELQTALGQEDAATADMIRIISLGDADSQLIDRAKALAMRTPIVEDSSQSKLSWRYSYQQPGENWINPDFDDTAWNVGAMSFGSYANDKTMWRGPDIWMRLEFELIEPVTKPPFLDAHIDDVAEFYVNGVHAGDGQWVGRGNQRIYQRINCPPNVVESLKPGRNVLAIHCHDIGGGGAAIDAKLFLDEGVQGWEDLLTEAIDKDPENVHLLQTRFQAHAERGDSELAAQDAATLLPLLREAVKAELESADVVWPASADMLSDVLLATYQTEDPDSELANEVRDLPGGWDRLAAAYYLLGDTKSLDQLLEYKPQATVGIGDLYAAGENWVQAIASYNRLISKDTTDVSLFVKRGEAYAGLAQWENAESDWRRAAKLFPGVLQEPFDRYRRAANWQAAAKIGIVLVEQDPSDRMVWLRAAPALALAGDEPSYRDFCNRMITQFGDTSNGPAAEATCKACLLIPDCVDIADLPLSVFSDKLDEGKVPSGLRAWFWACRALVAYRNGDVNLASTYTPKAFQSQPGAPALALTYSIAALERHGRGDSDGARESLGHATRMIEQQMPDSSAGDLHDWMIPLVLVREAEKLLEDEQN